MHACVCLGVHCSMYVHTYICYNVDTRKYVAVCVHTCMCVCVYARLHDTVCVCVYHEYLCAVCMSHKHHKMSACTCVWCVHAQLYFLHADF
jgi:hypothetical protein